MKENHFNCIYMYTNKINGKKYIGQAKNFNKRHGEHIRSSHNKNQKYDYNVPFHCAIRKYRIENFDIKILAENLTQEKMNEYEKFFIKRHNTLTKNNYGYNISTGGSNGNNFAGKTLEEMNLIKKHMSENHANFKGENHPQYGKKQTEEQIIKRAKKKQIKIVQLDENENIINIWDSAKIASDTLKINNSNIVQCCKFWEINCDKEKWFENHKIRPSKKAGGFIWKYYKK